MVYSRFLLVICFIYRLVYMSVPASLFLMSMLGVNQVCLLGLNSSVSKMKIIIPYLTG